MDEVLRKPDWIPYYIQRIKGSSAWQLEDFKFCWYWKLLTEAADSDIPGYLVNDVRTLWRLAGARTEKFFRERGGMELVARYFSRTDDGLHIYNEKLLEVLHQQMAKLTKRRKRSALSISVSLQSVPEFINQELFHKFVEMREKIGKPMTGHAITLAYGKLEKLKEQGHDPNAVIEQSIFNSWQGLFPIAQVTNGLRGRGDDVVGTQANGNGRPPEKKSTINPQCQTCGGTGFDLSSGKAVTCPCRRRVEANPKYATTGRSGTERPMPNVAGAGRDFKAAGANDR